MQPDSRASGRRGRWLLKGGGWVSPDRGERERVDRAGRCRCRHERTHLGQRGLRPCCGNPPVRRGGEHHRWRACVVRPRTCSRRSWHTPNFHQSTGGCRLMPRTVSADAKSNDARCLRARLKSVASMAAERLTCRSRIVAVARAADEPSALRQSDRRRATPRPEGAPPGLEQLVAAVKAVLYGPACQGLPCAVAAAHLRFRWNVGGPRYYATTEESTGRGKGCRRLRRTGPTPARCL